MHALAQEACALAVDVVDHEGDQQPVRVAAAHGSQRLEGRQVGAPEYPALEGAVLAVPELPETAGDYLRTDSGGLHPAIAMDLIMLVNFVEARERFPHEYTQLDAGGFALYEVVELPSGFSILDCGPLPRQRAPPTTGSRLGLPCRLRRPVSGARWPESPSQEWSCAPPYSPSRSTASAVTTAP